MDILDHLGALLKTVSNFLCLRLKKSISFSRLPHKYERNTAKNGQLCSQVGMTQFRSGYMGLPLLTRYPYRGSINDEDYLVGSLTSE